jgi:tetratricopeptide (TPR) repeat protein
LRTARRQPAPVRFIETVPRRGYRFIAVPAAVPAASPAVPSIDAVAGALPSPSFIGRADALERLRRAWDRACSGQRAVVWVAGDPGIGKTTLIEYFAAGLGDIACARGQCMELYGAGEPYLPVLEALAELCRNDPALPTLLRAVAPTWLLQLPWLTSSEERDALRRELAGVSPDRMLREMGELLDRYTEQRPLLLVTEDLHWSDRSTVQLIDYLARRRGHARLMWLASFRLSEVIALDHPLNSLRHELRLHRLCDEVVLDPFSESEVAEFVALHSASLAQDESFVGLCRRTDGLPLFVASVTADVMEHADDQAYSRPSSPQCGTENLAAIIDHYIARLSGEQRALLSAAAVCGAEFRVETVALALGSDAASVALACEDLVHDRIWLATPRAGERSDAAEPPYAFRHQLFRQALYDRTPPSARRQLHCKVGEAMERERAAGAPVAASELALHFERGRRAMTALSYYVEAAEFALAHFSPSACLGFAERASSLIGQAPDGLERDKLEIDAATLYALAAFQSLGVGSEARNAFERAYRLLTGIPQHPVRGRLLHGFGFLLSLRGEYAEALAVAEFTEKLSRESNEPALQLIAWIVQAHVHHSLCHSQTTRQLLERALAVAENTDIGTYGIFAADPQVLCSDCWRWSSLARPDSAKSSPHAACADRAHALSQPMAQLVATWYEVLIGVRLDNPARVATVAEEMQALFDEYSLALGRTACRWWRAWADARLGAPLDAYRRIRAAWEEHAALGMRSGASEVLGYAAEALLLAGDPEGAQAELQEALRVADELGERVYLPQLFLLDAAIARAQGRPDAGSAAVRRAVEEARVRKRPGWNFSHSWSCARRTMPRPRNARPLPR